MTTNEQRLREHEAEHAKFYLHSDDNYYWTPEAWREFQSLRAQLASRDERIAKLREAMKESQARSEDVADSWCHVPLREALAEDDRLRGQG